MKELSIKEKAKRYDEAKLRMSAAYNSNRCTIGFMNEIFPELRESEDEKIRKDIVTYLKSVIDNKGYRDKIIESWIARLENTQYAIDHAKREGFQLGYKTGIEKQEQILANSAKTCKDEQKPVVETKVIIPKFRVGDIVKSKSQPMLSPRKIISIGKDCYWCEDRGCIGFAWEHDCEIVEQKPVEWHREDEQNLNACLGYIPDEFLRRWLMDVIHAKYDKPANKVESKFHEGEWITIKQ